MVWTPKFWAILPFPKKDKPKFTNIIKSLNNIQLRATVASMDSQVMEQTLDSWICFLTCLKMESHGSQWVQITAPILEERFVVIIKETVLRKSEYQQKVLKFKKTSTFSQNLFIEKSFWMQVQPNWPQFQIPKRYNSERI